MAAVTGPPLRFVSGYPSVRSFLVALLPVLVAYAVSAPSSARAADSGFLSAEITATHFFEPLEHNVVNLAGEFADGTLYTANFLDNFTHTGGIERWGYPTSAVVEESRGNLTQYYQRGVVDWQPPPGGGSPTFQRRLAWDYLGGGLGGSVDQGVELHLTNPNPGDLLGPWGHKVSNISVEGVPIGFADFFHRLGGVASFGFPKTDARQDDHSQAVLHTPGRPPDGRIRQYFQAAVLEYHPESPESPVKLSLLGDTLRDSRYPRRAWQQYLAFAPETPLAVGDHPELGLASRRGPHGSTVEAVARFLELSLLRVQTDQACGSGFFVTADGYALTTWRLVVDARSITVESPRGYTASAHLIAGDAQLDLALIKVDGNGHIPVLWGDAVSLVQGLDLMAVGYDATSVESGRGFECQTVPTATSVLTSYVQPGQQTEFLPTLNSGNSGGPVVTNTGIVVGIARSGSPDFSRSYSLTTAADTQAIVTTWIGDISQGITPTLPLRPRFDRIVLAEHDRVACPSGGSVEVWGSKLELTGTVILNPNMGPVGIIRFRNAYDHDWLAHDLIYFGKIWGNDGYSRLLWIRDEMGEYSTLRSGDHAVVASGVPFHVRFVYDAGQTGLFVNGGPVHQEAGLPHGEYLWLSLECLAPGGGPDIYFSNVRITGMPLPDR